MGGAKQYLVIPIGTKADCAPRALHPDAEAEVLRKHPPPPKMEAGPPPPKQGGKGGLPGAGAPGAEEEDDVIMIVVPPPKNAFDNYVPPPPKIGVKMPPQVKGHGGAKDAGKVPPAQPAKPAPALSKNQQ